MMKSSTLVLIASLLLISCFGGEERNNTIHTHIDEGGRNLVEVRASEVNPFVVAVDSLSEKIFATDEERLPYLIEIFSTHINKSLMMEAITLLDPEIKSSFITFHKWLLLIVFNNSSEETIRKLISSYYNLLLSDICFGEFEDCITISYLQNDPYAGELFLSLSEVEEYARREVYLDFVSSLGVDGGDVDIRLIRIRERMMINVANWENTDRTQFFNDILFVTNADKDIDISFLSDIYSFIQNIRSEQKNYFNPFQSLLIDLISQGRLGVDSELLSRIMRDQAAENLVVQENSDYDKGLFWGKDFKPLDVNSLENLEKFLLMGLVNSVHSGPLHSFLLSEYIQVPEQRSRLLGLLKSYVDSLFIINIYKSHEVIGRVFNEELERRNVVELVFTSFARKADSELALIWNEGFRNFVKNFAENLSSYFESNEIDPLVQVGNNLEENIKTMVIYPALFLVGYHVSLQGNFNYQVIRLNPFTNLREVWNMSSEIYFQELFRGQFPTFFSFVTVEAGIEQENLLSFYYSGDQYLLDFYKVPSDFVAIFLNRYFVRDRRVITEEIERLDEFFRPGEIANKLFSECEKIEQGDYDFSYNNTFVHSETSGFFRGQINNGTTGRGGLNSSKYLTYLFHFFSPSLTTKNLSSVTEYFRVETGLRIHRIKVLAEAFRIQGMVDNSQILSDGVRVMEADIQSYLDIAEQRFQESVSCSLTQEKLEKEMRTHFLKKEVDFFVSLYTVLKWLNDYGADVDIADLRLYDSDKFSMSGIKDLPINGSLLDEWNKYYFSSMEIVTSYVNDYSGIYGEVHGLVINADGKVFFRSSSKETIFRSLSYFIGSELEGVKFPRMNLVDMPSNSDQLENIVLSGTIDRGKTFTMSYQQEVDEKEFIQAAFSELHMKSSRQAARKISYSERAWRNIYLNYGSLFKAKTYFKALSSETLDIEPQHIIDQISVGLSFLSDTTVDLLNHYNLNEDDQEILNLLDRRDMRFERDWIARYGFTGNKAFYYLDSVGSEDLMPFDVLFSVLASRQLGRWPVLAHNLYGRLDSNPLLDDWGRKVSSSSGGNNPADNGDASDESEMPQIQPEDILFPTDIERYAVRNAREIHFWEQNAIVPVPDFVKELIHKEIKLLVQTDRKLQDAALEWMTEKVDVGFQTGAYRLNFLVHPEPVVQTEYVSRTILRNFYGNRSSFDEETFNVFKLDESTSN